MSLFDADTASSNKKIDRTRLPVGTYLVKCKDAFEVIGGYKGNRIQFDFSVVRGPAPAGTVKGQLHMAQPDQQKQKLENGKVQREIAAFLGVDVRAVTNEVFGKAVRSRKERPGINGSEILSESFPAKDSIIFGKECVVKCKPYRNKAGELTSFYEFEAFDPDVHTHFEEYDISAERAAVAAAEAAAVAVEEADFPEIAPPEPEAVLSPEEKMAAAGWKTHPKNSSYVYLGKVVRPKAEVMSEFDGLIPF